jgi:hypothetical protein
MDAMGQTWKYEKIWNFHENMKHKTQQGLDENGRQKI